MHPLHDTDSRNIGDRPTTPTKEASETMYQPFKRSGNVRPMDPATMPLCPGPKCKEHPRTGPKAGKEEQLCQVCETTPYCSPDCRWADWKTHQQICAGKPDGSPLPRATDIGSPLKGLETPILRPFTRLTEGTWLHDRPQGDVYRILVDTYRFRIQDMFEFEQVVEEDSIYNGKDSGTKGFSRFLDLFYTKESNPILTSRGQSLLPPWWTDTTRAACETFANAQGPEQSNWYSLAWKITMEEVVHRYGDNTFGMQLRVFAEHVHGKAVAGVSSHEMVTGFKSMETRLGAVAFY
ncbi:hypothetical protein G7046_g4631 [Stylonectria norvegica]|nr:hypothetical protein G7046_g4631 [Stylonectria norvegica]